MRENRDHLDSVIKQVFKRMKELSQRPKTCPNEETLAAYQEGSLTKEEAEQIEEHLVLCERCTENLILLSEARSSYDFAEDSFATKGMVERAKDLVKPRPGPRLWERASSWFSSFGPVPLMAAASVVLVIVVLGIYNLYTPYEPGEKKFTPLSLGLIARVPSDMVTKGKSPVYKEVEVQEGGVLRSGDTFRVRFKIPAEAYVYLLALDSMGNLTKLFPKAAPGAHVKVKAGQSYVVPEKDEWLLLDKNTGQETIYILVSSKAIKDIDQKIDQLKESGIDKVAMILPGVTIQSFSFKHQ
jgi:hypothetical protein